MLKKLTGVWSRLSKKTKLAAVAIALLLVGIAGWKLIGAGSKDTGYITYQASYADIVQTATASGQVEPVQSVTLTFKSQGYVQECKVKVGDTVKAGQVLAVERSEDLETALEQAQASLDNARASYNRLVSTYPHKVAQAQAQVDQSKSSLDIAKAEFERSEPLFEAGVISQSELDSARASYQSALSQYQNALSNLELTKDKGDIEVAAAQVKSAEAQVSQAQNNLNNCVMIAPFDGFVAAITGNTGQWTAAGTSSEASSSQFSITVSSTELQLAAQVNEADISKVKVGQKVTFTVNAYPDREFSGKLLSLSPLATTSNNVQVYDAVISIDDYQDLRAGMPASITIIVGEAKNVLAVPQSALDYGETYLASNRSLSKTGTDVRSSSSQARSQTKETSNFSGRATNQASNRKPIVVLVDGKEALKWVETGLSDDVSIEIKSGLKEGEVVITSKVNSTATSTSSTSTRSSTRNNAGPAFPGGPFMH